MRTIDADALLKKIDEDADFYLVGDDENSKAVGGALLGVKEQINTMPTIEPHKWTSVDEALPRDDEDVIVTCLDDSGDTPYSYTAVAWHYKGMWVCDNMRCLFVTAWMPLPEPYKGEER